MVCTYEYISRAAQSIMYMKLKYLGYLNATVKHKVHQNMAKVQQTANFHNLNFKVQQQIRKDLKIVSSLK